MKLILSNPSFTPNFKIRHQYKLFFMGSCFADAMSVYFKERKFSLLQNPYGVLYNPVSIASAFGQITSSKKSEQREFYERDEMFYSWNHHSKVCATTAEELHNKIQKINEHSLSFLKQSDVVFVTLGTAWVYWHKQKKEVVANNLRAPSDLFERKLLSQEKIVESLEKIKNSIKSVNGNAQIVFTLSPIRYAKLGLVESNRGKARLLDGIHAVCEKDDSIEYFPTYELVIDVLRDYRFFKKDLVHPNGQARDYIWEFFKETFLDSTDYDLVDSLYKLHLAANHKIVNIQGVETQKFKAQQLEIIKQLEQKYAHLYLEEERKYFKVL